MANLFNLPWLTESIKKCTIKYLIERYLGHFLYEELDLSQLDIELFNGTATIESIPLNVHTINQEVSQYFPLQFQRGFVNRIEFSVPWSALWTDSCTIQLDGIRLNFCPVPGGQSSPPAAPGAANQTSILSKSVMASSMEMAEEILQPEPEKYEGLEKFAQLINSIIRRVKLVATDTVVKFAFAHGSEAADSRQNQDEIELRLGHLRCEEEEIILDQPTSRDTEKNALMLSDVVTKRITVEGFQLSINGSLITKLSGKHTFKIRFADQKIDLEAFFGSYIFAILNWQHFAVLEIFAQMMGVTSQPDGGYGIRGQTPQERPMTSQDYRQIQEIWRREMPASLSVPESLGGGGKTWTADTDMPEEEFMSFHQQQQQQDPDTAAAAHSKPGQGETMFACNIKIPGIMVCVISDDNQDQELPLFGGMPLIDNLQTLIGINSHLDEMLREFSHIRLLASNLFVEVNLKADLVSFSCINVSAYEYHRGTLNNLFWVKDDDGRDAIMPSVRLRKTKQALNVTLSPTCARIDPTVVERHPRLVELLLGTHRSPPPPPPQLTIRQAARNEMVVNVECEHLQLELYFPVPDLRPERSQYSALHEEILLVGLHDIRIIVDSSTGELLCRQVDIDLRTANDDASRKLFHSRSEQRNIKLHVSTSVPLALDRESDDDDPMTGISSMSESVNFLHSSAFRAHKGENKPFQVKRNMVGGGGDEEIVTPGDRDHIRHYLAYNREMTKLFTYIHVPYGEVYLENHAMFELIYNRFANDLIFWRPFVPPRKPAATGTADRSQSPPQLILPNFNLDMEEETGGSHQDASRQIFYSCRIRPDSSSFSDDDDGDEAVTTFHSVMESCVTGLANPQNDFVVELEMEHLTIDFHTGSGDLKRNNLFVQNFLLGIIGGGGGGGGGEDAAGGTVVCFCSDNLSYKVQDRAVLVNHSHLDLVSELNAAVEIRRSDDRDALKKIKLAVQLRNGMLVGLDLSVFEELWQFVNVKDEEILGYQCPTVTMELHANVVKSGILFDQLRERPVMLHVEDVYLTSMVVENTLQTVLRFFIEEALLCFKRNTVCPDSWHNFISVLDSGIIDINLKIAKDGQIEWKGSNNEINLHVCHDSLAALCQFVQSFGASDQQQQPRPQPVAEEEAEIHTKRPDELARNNQLIADALVECDTPLRIKPPCSNCRADSPTVPAAMEESHFLILGENDLGSGINTSGEPKVRVLDDGQSIQVVDNHFSITHYNVIPDIGPATLARYLLDRMSLQIYLYAGHDFDDVADDGISSGTGGGDKRRSTDAISQARMSLRRNEQRVRFQQNSVLWENIDLVSSSHAFGSLGNASQFEHHAGGHSHALLKSHGGPKRKTDTYVVLALKNIKMLFDQFRGPESGWPMSWMFLFLVEEVTIIDKVSVSKIKKMLYEYYSDAMPRRKYSNMLSVRFNCFRNGPDGRQEGDLTVSLKPLRINIDQDTLFFLMEFFSNFSDTLSAKQQQTDGDSTMVTGGGGGGDHDDDDDDCDGDTEFAGNEDDQISEPTKVRRASTSSGGGGLDAIFIKSFTFCPEVPIRLDYHGKHIDLKQGPLRGVALGLAQLNQSELCLKKLVNKHGLLGLEKVIQYAVEEWGRDIKRNQLPSILGGVGPLHSFIQLFQGIRDLFWIPIDQYRRDQRIVRGIQRGAYAFSVSTAMATLELANRLVWLIQSTAQFAHDVVTPPSTSGRARGTATGATVPAAVAGGRAQPRDMREGITVAYALVRQGFHDTVRGMTNQNLVADDAVTVIGQVVRQIPSTVVRPVIHLSQATNSVLVGIRNQFAPEARKDDQEKWKNANER